MKISICATLAALSLALPAVAQEGDAAKGEKEFNKCKACHMVQAPDGTDIVKGGKTGPNLYGVVGRKIASEEGFKYGDGILEVAEKNPDLVWTEADLIEYVTDPKPWLVEKTGDSAAKTKMTFKLGKNQADVVAFLAQNSPDAGAEAAPAEDAAD
ncbi:cytochrome c [Paracoccus pantotrophus]|nr:cytochrome C [Paracoccus pantotrophus]QFG37274.1 cytochrome C [Paracoccus pantotrophus]RKS52294.1 cytochrome c [Paracoccus pantotrophus]